MKPFLRGSIIATLFDRNFIAEKGKNIIPTPIGEKLYDALPDTIKYPDMTAIWHEQIKDIRQKNDIQNFINQLMQFIDSEIKASVSATNAFTPKLAVVWPIAGKG